MRPILRKASLALVGAGAAAAMVLASGSASFAVTVIKTTNQAGYQAGNSSFRFRFVQGAFTLPLNGCTNGNYRSSGAQLIGASNAAVGVQCVGGAYQLGWRTAYVGSGTTFPTLTNNLAPVAAGHKILVQIFYDQATNFVHFTLMDLTAGVTRLTTSTNAGAALFKKAVLSTDVPNPLPSPPPPNQNFVLVPWTSGAVTTYNGTRGTGICGPWGVAEQEAVSGEHIIAAAPVLFNNCSQFNVRIFGHS